MRIDVAICTWNRSSLLAQTLERLLDLNIPPGVEWELLVVDNNSTDATAEVLRGFQPRLPLRSVFEPRPGQANARNRALHETRATYLIWTDDDVLVDLEWIAAYSRAFQKHPDAAVFGGPIEPWFDGTPPRWLADHWQQVASVFAVRQLGDEPFEFDDARVPYGANFAVKTAVQREYPYDPSLGLRPGSEVRGEETHMIRRMLAAGHTGWWVPDAKVRHFIPRHRQSVRYVRQVIAGVGEVRWREWTSPRLIDAPRLLLKKAVAAEARYRWSRLTDRPDVWLARLREAARAWGHWKGASGAR
jgi:glucosyl-dolichyl phosphate glucuronosyltransferase